MLTEMILSSSSSVEVGVGMKKTDAPLPNLLARRMDELGRSQGQVVEKMDVRAREEGVELLESYLAGERIPDGFEEHDPGLKSCNCHPPGAF